MIDSPASDTLSTGAASRVNVSRGYNFAGVCQWLAERADLILLFFDPDKPGTTGETLNILTSALTGHDYKLRILLNSLAEFMTLLVAMVASAGAPTFPSLFIVFL